MFSELKRKKSFGKSIIMSPSFLKTIRQAKKLTILDIMSQYSFSTLVCADGQTLQARAKATITSFPIL